MLIENDIKKLLEELVHRDSAKIDLGGSSITVKTLNHGSKISLSTPVYFGGNYIPKSVRNCLTKRAPPFESYSLDADLIVDEEHFRVYLNYIGNIGSIKGRYIINVLEDFTGLAERWREYLDEHDQNDLVYIRAAR